MLEHVYKCSDSLTFFVFFLFAKALEILDSTTLYHLTFTEVYLQQTIVIPASQIEVFLIVTRHFLTMTAPVVDAEVAGLVKCAPLAPLTIIYSRGY